MEVVFVAGMLGFCGSRDLPVSSADSALVAGVVGSVLAALPRRGVAVGCAVGGEAPSSSPQHSPWARPPGHMSSPRSAPSPRPGPPLVSLLPTRLPPSLRSPAWQAPSPPAPPSPGGAGVVPQSPWPAGSLPAPQSSSRRSPPPARGAASSGSSPRPVRPASGPLLLPRSASPAPVPGRGLPSRLPRASVSPSWSSPSGGWRLPALQARSRTRGVRGLHWAHLDLAPPGRAVSASCPLARLSSAARRGPCFF